MRILLIFLFLFIGISASSQTSTRVEDYQESLFNDEAVEKFKDQEYIKDKNYSKERSFNDNLKQKYSGEDFIYTDEVRQVETVERKSEPNKSISTGFSFLGSSLPFIILIVLAVVVILAILQRSDFGNFRLKRYNSADAEILQSEEDESIDEGDFERLLQRAIKNGNFRLATRYYYLWLLQQLSQKNYIEYHKDKTNSEYQFELKDKEIRSGFSYLSYVYSYIWYGEFSIDQIQFASIEEKYKSFMKQIK